MKRIAFTLAVLCLSVIALKLQADEAPQLRNEARAAMMNAASFYREQVASHGGYVYFYSLDLEQRWGEGVATKDQIWVQPPGTPTVGLAYLKAYQATGDRFYLDAATAAAEAIAYGQMQSGGWTNCIDFDPRGARVAQYRNGNGRGRNTSSLDDGQTQSAIRLLIHADQALNFKHAEIHQAAKIALDALLNAQFPNGAFPQVWDDDVVPDPPILQANYPDYDWRTEGRIKEYWDMYTLNDNVTGYVAETLLDAHQIYEDQRYLQALRKLGDFLLLAQMPEPQPAWAQQYNYEMQPIWARKFEPPGVSGDESQEVIATLMKISIATGDRKYLEPIPRALAYLKRSLLADGKLSRYYELKTNKPLYMVRRGSQYDLTYDDSSLPAHYGWKGESQIEELEAEYGLLKSGGRKKSQAIAEADVRQIISQLDDRGRWVSTYGGERLVGQAKMPLGAKYLSSEVFSSNLTALSEYYRSVAPVTDQSRSGEVKPADAVAAGPPVDDDDPLLKALNELQREIEQLRGEIRGQRPATGAKPSMKSPEPPATNPAPVEQSPPARPATTVARASRNAKPVSIARSTTDHWSFQPVGGPSPPAVRDEGWIRDDLDRFILARLEQAQLKPNPDADRYALIRRVAFDLTGLPPAESEIHDFIDDSAPLDEALARIVDRYLDSPRFGERWGRHWLDVVRYADSVGRNWNAPFTYAWRYRNYVIDSLNEDKPYDRFIIEQLAGDLLPADDLRSRREQLVATGFLAIGPTDIIVPEGEPLKMDRIDEQIDVTSRAMLALTVSCARCHDHKYEPITMRDYYALAGVFYSTETLSGQRRGNYVADDDLHLLPSSDGRKTAVAGVHSMADMTREFRSGGYREVFWTTDPNLAMGAAEGRTQDCPIRLDGEPWKQGEAPPRGDFRIAGLSGLSGIGADSSGRLQLARWITSPENPLTARVMVNRVWGHLFGRGIVDSVDNFGVSGGQPTHPQLLDHLASRFSRSWSIKSLIRSIVLSRTYRQSSEGQVAGQRIDPGNELYWRMNLRRLEVEALRDAMLAVAGRISFARPDGVQVAGTGGKGRWAQTRSLLEIDAPYRTVYLPVLRDLLPEMYSTFDFPNPTQLQGQREVTTVAPQSLFLMNSDFATACARDAANRLLAEAGLTDADRVVRIYLRLLGRHPDKEEIAASLDLVDHLTGRDSESYLWSALIQALMIGGEFRSLL